MATFYCDFNAGSDNNAGSPFTAPWQTLDQFTENARNPSDKLICRRGVTQAVSSDVTFTSDGILGSPIIIEADYDDVWSDFGTSSQTYTLTFGAKTAEASAAITDIQAGSWIYNSTDGDDAREYSYEVRSVSNGSVINFQLPFKGSTGATKTLTIMPSAPQWNTIAGNFQLVFSSDHNWKIQGLDLRGTDGNGNIALDSSIFHEFKDCRFIGDATSSYGISNIDDSAVVNVFKCYFSGLTTGILSFAGTSGFRNTWVKDCLFEESLESLEFNYWDELLLEESEMDASSNVNFFTFNNVASTLRTRNVSGLTMTGGNTQGGAKVFTEDDDNTRGVNSQYIRNSFTNPVLASENTIVRGGGGTTSIKLTPGSLFNPVWLHSTQKLFEYPIYADTSSKQYDVYFRPGSIAEWTANPTADELWIEAEYWAGNKHRQITKSTTTLGFTGSTDWGPISVTAQPNTSGVLYLRGWYAKPKEAGNNNIFYVDTKPTIT